MQGRPRGCIEVVLGLTPHTPPTLGSSHTAGPQHDEVTHILCVSQQVQLLACINDKASRNQANLEMLTKQHDHCARIAGHGFQTIEKFVPRNCIAGLMWA